MSHAEIERLSAMVRWFDGDRQYGDPCWAAAVRYLDAKTVELHIAQQPLSKAGHRDVLAAFASEGVETVIVRRYKPDGREIVRRIKAKTRTPKHFTERIPRMWQVQLTYRAPRQMEYRFREKINLGIVAETASEAIALGIASLPADSEDVVVWSVNHLSRVDAKTRAPRLDAHQPTEVASCPAW